MWTRFIRITRKHGTNLKGYSNRQIMARRQRELEMLKEGLSLAEIARRVGKSATTIYMDMIRLAITFDEYLMEREDERMREDMNFIDTHFGFNRRIE